MIKSPAEVKASQVRLARQEMDGTRGMSLSPFIVAASDAVTIERLRLLSADVSKARQTLEMMADTKVEIDGSRAQSVKAVAREYVGSRDDVERTSKFNASFLKSSGRLIESMCALEKKIAKSNAFPEEAAIETMMQLNNFGIFVDAARVVYKVEVRTPQGI